MGMAETGAAFVLIALALWFDLRYMRIPNWLTVAGAASAIIYMSVISGLEGSVKSLAGLAAGLLPMLVLYLCRGIGAGDVKLFAALGAWIGVYPVLYTAMYSILIAGAIGAVLLAVHRPFFIRVVNIVLPPVLRMSGWSSGLNQAWRQGMTFPFMLAAAPGAAAAWYFAF